MARAHAIGARRTQSAAQKRATYKYNFARRRKAETGIKLTPSELMKYGGGHTFAITGNPPYHVDGYPIDIWPVAAKTENYRKGRTAVEVTPGEWFRICRSRGWQPMRASLKADLIFCVQDGPADRQIEPLRKFPWNPMSPKVT
jgi:hypothetical protein